MRLFRTKTHQTFRENPPCERCDEIVTGLFRGEAHPLILMGSPVLSGRGYWDQFEDLYPRPLWLCGTCSVALMFWFNRREFLTGFPRGKLMLKDAVASLSDLRCGPFQLVGTPTRIFKPSDVLAMGLVAEYDSDLGSRVCTRKSFADEGERLLRIARWIRIWESENPVFQA